MKHYIVYTNDGQITKTGKCQDNDLNLQGDLVIEGTANDSTQYVDNGQIKDMPPKPEGEAYFDYATKKWVLDYNTQGAVIKEQRDKLLYKCDWTQIPNNPLPEVVQQEWSVYRQSLRDITSQVGYPFNVIWPTPPQ